MRSLTRPRRRLIRPSEADVARARLSREDRSPEGIARRRFLQGAVATGGAVGLMPSFLDSVAASAAPLSPTDRILVSVFLNGGNDHLNTLVPAENGTYHSARGPLAVAVDNSHAIGEGLYLHPNLSRLKTRFDAGQVAFIRGVGESSDDHSHFTSTATWMAGYQGLANPTGWLGRYIDGVGGDGLGAVHVGWGGTPMLLRGTASRGMSLPPSGTLFGADRSEAWERLAIETVSNMGGGGVGGAFGNTVGSSLRSAVDTAELIQPAYVDGLAEDYLARDLGLAAQVINLDLGTRVVSVALDGFDSHDSQRPAHDDLLAELDRAIDAFFANLAPAFASRTVMLVWSEFGRRVESNVSAGTDHGTAGMMMLIGPRVAGGLHGVQPSITSLDTRGDMHHHLDFRSVYATLLEQWLDADATEVLGSGYSQLGVLAEGGGSFFFDVPASAYYADAVAWLAAAGITTGTGVGTFSPDDVVTRAQMATFLWRYRNTPGGSPSAGFVDVPAGRYYSDAVDWLAHQGITTGTSPGRYSPDDVVTRAQMATFLWRLEGSPGGAPRAGFSDVSPGAWYADAVDWLLEEEITTGVGGNRYAPDDPVTRGQMATFLWRLAGRPS